MFGSPQGNPLLQIGASGIRQWRLDSQNRETIEKWEQEDWVDRADGAGWKIPECYRKQRHPREESTNLVGDI